MSITTPETKKKSGTPDPQTICAVGRPHRSLQSNTTAMLLEDIIQPDGVLCNASARSKKHCLEILSELLVRGRPDVASEVIFACLNDRERLGCTGLDRGAAFPHCRIDGLEQSHAALIKLSDPIEFDAADGELVDLVFGMIVPTELGDEHRADIKMITQVLADEGLRSRLRSTQSSKELYASLISGSALVTPEPVAAAQGT